MFGQVGKPDKEDKNRTYMFLFSDVLLIAKPKGRGTFLLKDRMKLAEAWIGTVGAPRGGRSTRVRSTLMGSQIFLFLVVADVHFKY